MGKRRSIDVIEAERDETPAHRKWLGNLCGCTCGDQCPAGRIGSGTRCTVGELRLLGLRLTAERDAARAEVRARGDALLRILDQVLTLERLIRSIEPRVEG